MNSKHPHQSKPLAGRAGSNLIRALEPRIMFDGAAVATAVDVAHTDVGHSAPVHKSADVESVTSLTPVAQAAPVTLDAVKPATEIVFIDGNLPDLQQLQAGVKPSIEVVILDSTKNGLNQIANYLDGREGIDAIHIISHGQHGQITLGNAEINQSTLDQQAQTLAKIGASLNANGDILLYGCDVSAGDTGNNFVSQLATITQADIAASTDKTGSTELLGNWTLETSKGNIDHDDPFLADTLNNYQHILPTILSAGDIAVLGLNGDDTASAQRWSFVALTDVTTGTVIHFTDAGYTDTGAFLNGPTNEGHMSWTLASNVSAGTVFVVTNSNAGTASMATAAGASVSGVTGTLGGSATAFSGAGDQIIVYQGTSGTTTGATFIYAFNNGQAGTYSSNGAWQTSNAVTVQTQSYLPSGLTNGTSALALTSFVGNSSSGTDGAGAVYGFDNMRYGGTVSGTKAQILAAIGTASNWRGSDTTPYDFATQYASNFTISSPPTLVSGTFSDNALRIGETSTVTFTFSTAVSGFTTADLTVPNGDITGLSTSDGGTTWTGTFTPNASVTDSTNVITVNLAGVTSVSESVAGTGTADSNNYAIDTAAPAVTSVSSTTTNSHYVTGQTVDVTITFAENVTVTGTPQLTLETGSTDRVVNYSSGSGTNTLTFNYTVQVGDTSLDLDYLGTTALALNGGTIRDSSGNDATLTLAAPGAAGSLGANKAIVIDSAPIISNLGGDSVAWAGVGNTITLDSGSNASISDSEFAALNGGNGDWAGATLTVRRPGSTLAANIFGFDTSGATFTVSGGNLQAGGLTFATYTSTSGVLTVNFTSSATAATTALIQDIMHRITYRNDTPGGDTTIRFTLDDSYSSNTADVTVTSDTIYVTNTTDTAAINVANGVSFSEAVAIAAADVTGSQILVFSSAFNSGAVTLAGNLAINESLTVNADSASGLSLNGSTITLGGGTTLSFTNNSGTVTFTSALAGSGNLLKQGSGIITLAGTNTYSGTTTVSAGTLSIASDSNLGSDSVTLASGATLDISGATNIDNAIALSGDATVSNSANATLSGIISGANILTKAGAATLTLSNTNTYAGTTVSAGMLSVASDANLGSGAVTLASGSTLGITGATNIDNAIALTGNATVSNSANATLSGVVSGTNTLTKAGAATLTLSNTNTYAGTTVSAGMLSVASDANLGSGAVTLTAGSTLGITGTTNIDNAIALTGNATVSNSANATLSGVISGGFNLAKTGVSTLTLSNTNTYGGTTTVSAGGLSVASDSNLGSGGLTLAAGTTLAVTGATTIDNAVTLSGAATVNTTADATLSGNIGGVGSLAKTGASTLTLSGTNSYAGTTTVSAGTLSISSDGNLGSSTVTLATGTTLAVTGSTTIDNPIALSGNATVQAANAVTLSGAISGAGGLSKTGAGTVTLSGSNGFTGNVAVSAGGLTLSGGAAIDNNSAITMSSGTTLTLSSSETIGSLAGAGAVALGANTLTAGGDNTSTSYSGNISGTGGGITKTGAGTLTLSGTNSNTGATTISAGAIDAQNGDAIGNASAVSVASGAFLVLSAAETIGSLAGAGSVSLAANTLTAGGNNTSTTFSGDLNGNGTLVKDGSGTLTLSNAGNSGSMSGDITVSGGTLSVGSDNNLSSGTVTLAGGTALDVTGATNIDNAISLTGNATVNNSANATLSGTISGANNLTKTGASTLTLSGTNSYAGTTVSAGTLSVASDSNLGSGGVTLASSTLAVTGATTIDNAIAVSGTVVLSNSDAVNLSGAISGSGTLNKSGASTLTLSGNNAAHSGSMNVNAGTLSIGGDSNLGSGLLTLNNATTLAVTSGGTIDNNLALAGNATLQTAATTIWSGVISGNNNLTKIGSSTLTLSNTNTLTGNITVSAGILSVTGTASTTLVASGATLTGTGTIDGPVTVQSGGTLSPGSSPGTLTINGDLTMDSGSTLVVEIDGATAGTGYDQVIVNGTVDVSGATLSVIHGYVAGSGDVYDIIINDAADAVTGSFSGISEGATVTAGGNSTVLTTSYIGATGNDVTLTAPVNPVVTSVSSSTPNGAYKIGDTISVSVNFDMAVFVSGGTPTLLLETGTVDRTLNYVSGSGSTTLVFDYTVQAGDLSADLDYTSTGALVLNGGTIQDALTNNASLTLASPGAANSLGANKALVVDGVVPTASIVVADTALAAGETSLVTITFSEAVTGLASGDVIVANGVLNGLSTGDGGITWTATLTPTVSTTNTSNLITLDNTGVADAAGNTGTGTTDSNNYVIDTLRPTATIVVADTALAAGETSTVTITFNEAVTGLTIADFTVANGVLSGLSTGNGGITWTATLTPTASTTDTSNLITLDNTGVADAAGNTGTGTTNSNNYAIDTLRPTATIVVADTALAAGETSTFTITFNEAVTGLTIADFTVANGVLSGLSTGNGGITWTATLTPTTSTTDISNLITLDNTGVADAAGNTGTGTTDSNNYAIDTARPTVTIVVADTALAVGETSLVTITFSEAVTGFTNADLTIDNGTLSIVSSSDGGITWTATFTPTASVTDPTNLITLTNTGVQDVAGNTGTGTTDSNNYAIDSTRPTATIVVADTSLGAGETSLVTITFNEAVTGFTNADLTIENGNLSAVSSTDGGITWTATLTPTASITDTTNLITLTNTGVQDVAGNTGTGTTDSNNYAIDTVRPTATIVVADTALIAGETSLVTLTFSEAVANFDNNDLTIANGTLSNMTTSDGGITWTGTFTPTADITDTTNVITFDSTGVIDGGGNVGAGPIDSNNYAIDTAGPTATIAVADSALAVGETSLVTITFSEAVSGFTNADLTVANGTLSSVTSSDGGITWTATFTPTASISDPTNSITLTNTGVIDAAGNAGTGTSDSNNYTIDSTSPTATVVIAETSLGADETSLVTITFNEAVTGFTNADLTIENGTLSAVSSSDGGITWTATLTPTASITDTTNLITLANTGVQDVAGNGGTGTTDSNNYAIDTVRPTATIVVADTALIAGETSLVTLTFSEAVANFDNNDLMGANGTLSNMTTSDGGITWTGTLTPTANITDTTNVITFDSNSVIDGGGNVGAGPIDSNNYGIDTARPTATIVVADTALAIGETSLVTITFSEAVTGFTNADLTIANGSLSTLTSNDSGVTWIATFTPTANITDTTNVITLDNSSVSDAAGNVGLGAIDSNNIVIDTAMPTVTSVSIPANGVYIAGQNLDFIVNLSEAVIIDGTPRIAITLDTGGTIYANYVSGSGTNALIFRTPIVSGQLDTTGIALGNIIEANGGSLQDVIGNDIAPALNAIPSTNDILVDAITPTVSIQLSGSPTALTQSLSYNVTFSEAVQHVDITDFSLATTGSTNASIGGIRQIDDQTWLVTVDKISGSGTVRLDVKTTNDITDSIGNSVSGGLTGTSFTTQMLPPVTAPTITAPLVLGVTETPVQTNTVAPLIVLSADASQVGGATNTTPLTTVEAPVLISSTPSFINGSSLITSLDTSTFGNDPIGTATATSTGTIGTAPAMSRLANGSTYAPTGPGNGPTIDRLNSTQDGGLQGLQATGKVDVQSGTPLYIPLPNTTSANPNEQISVDVRMVDGKPLAPWLRFDPVTGTLTGQAPKGFEGKMAIQITVRDSKGNTVSNVIELTFTKDNVQDKPAKTTPEKAAPDKTTSEKNKPGAQLMGKPALNDQFAQHGQRAHHAETDALLKALNQISVVPENARRA